MIPCDLEGAGAFREGLASVAIDGRWGFIDVLGNERIPFIWQSAGDFHHGRAAVCRGGKWGYIDRTATK